MENGTRLMKRRVDCEAEMVNTLSSRGVVLSQDKEDGNPAVIVAYLDPEDWVDFGKPAQVTVTFEPRDLPNEEA
jgi:hypothetical protein